VETVACVGIRLYLTLVIRNIRKVLVMTYKVRIDLEFDNKPTDIDVIDYLYQLLDCDVLHYDLVDTTEYHTYEHERNKDEVSL